MLAFILAILVTGIGMSSELPDSGFPPVAFYWDSLGHQALR